MIDVEMLEGVGLSIAASRTPLQRLGRYAGREIAERTGYRHVVRYLRSHQVGVFHGGSDTPHFVTPTCYSPDDAVSFLALPAPNLPPSHVLLLETEQIPLMLGPRRVRCGDGIEFYLPTGFPAMAVVPPGWEIQLG